jgi:protein subunit release factor B
MLRCTAFRSARFGNHSLTGQVVEKFIKGSGNGGQKINKVRNKVQLTHSPSGLQVNVQDTRSLNSNRKIARKRLHEKVNCQSKAEKLTRSQKMKQKKMSRAKRKGGGKMMAVSEAVMQFNSGRWGRHHSTCNQITTQHIPDQWFGLW